MMKKLFFAFLISFLMIGNATAQHRKRTMKPKKNAPSGPTWRYMCADPSQEFLDKIKPAKSDTNKVDTCKQVLTEKKDSIKNFVCELAPRPFFPGDLPEFIAKNFRYPPILANMCVQGRVIIGFFVDVDGTCSNFKVVRSVYPILDEEALRVAKLMPKWKWTSKPKKGMPLYIPVGFRM